MNKYPIIQLRLIKAFLTMQYWQLAQWQSASHHFRVAAGSNSEMEKIKSVTNEAFPLYHYWYWDPITYPFRGTVRRR